MKNALIVTSLILFSGIAQAKNLTINLHTEKGTCHYQVYDTANGSNLSIFKDQFNARITAGLKTNHEAGCKPYDFFEILVNESIWTNEDFRIAGKVVQTLIAQDNLQLNINIDQIKDAKPSEYVEAEFDFNTRKLKQKRVLRIDRSYVHLNSFKEYGFLIRQ